MSNPRKTPTPAEKRKARQTDASEQQAKRAPVTGKTPGQRDYLKSIKANEVTVCFGPAGTGKTFIPASYAAELMMVGEIEQIILCRPMIEAGGERMGALPGGIDRKMEPWTAPIMDVLEQKLGKGVVQQRMQEGKIKVVPFAYMRGRTFDRAFILADEMQNSTPAMARLLTTRIGEGSRAVISGDLAQCDLADPRSGLEATARIALDRQMTGVGVVQLTKDDIVRSAQCKQWVEGWEWFDTIPPLRAAA